MPMPKGHKVDKTGLIKNSVAPEFVPLTKRESEFIAEYIKTGNGITAWKNLGWEETSKYSVKTNVDRMLNKPNVRAEITRILEEITDECHKQAVANGDEVMAYFTSVMRGDIKDQFGLDAPLSERTRAAQELAKRTVDIENRRAGEADNVIQIKLDWSREG